MKYRTWDARTKDWGDYKFESSGTTVRGEAEKMLEEREREEEKKRLGLVRSVASKSLRDALIEFLDETKVMDREIPERNVRANHPILDVEVEGKSWWIRTLDFARDIDRCFGSVEIGVLLQAGAVERFSRYLEREGGARRKGVTQTSRSKTLRLASSKY